MRLLLIILVALYILPVSADDYIPPIGIPAPEFGINESHMMYVGAQYDFGNGLEDYKDAGNGSYTHYVDNSEGSNCSNNQSEYGSESAPRCSLSKREGVYSAGSVIGNVIYNIERFGVGLEKEARDAYILNNTFDNVGEGINQSSRRFILFKAFNNIFSNIGTYPFYVQHRDVSSVSTASNNLFFQNGSSFPIFWSPSDSNYTTTADLTNFPGGINNIVADPDLLLPSYAIGSNSGAINAGSVTGDAVFPYTQFEDLYGGISIRFDYNGVARPLSSQWDIGAIEFNPGFIFTNGFE